MSVIHTILAFLFLSAGIVYAKTSYQAFPCEGQRFNIVDCGTGEGDRTFCCNGDAYLISAYCPENEEIPYCCDSGDFRECLSGKKKNGDNADDYDNELAMANRRQERWVSEYSFWLFERKQREESQDDMPGKDKGKGKGSDILGNFNGCGFQIKDDLQKRLGFSITSSGGDGGGGGGGGGGDVIVTGSFGEDSSASRWARHYADSVFGAKGGEIKIVETSHVGKDGTITFEIPEEKMNLFRRKYSCGEEQKN